MLNWVFIFFIAAVVTAAIGFELVEGTALGVAIMMATILLVISLIIIIAINKKSH